MNRFRGGLVFKAHRLVYHSTLDLRVIKKKKKKGRQVTGLDRNQSTPAPCSQPALEFGV